MEILVAEGNSLSSHILLPATAVFAAMLVLVLSRTAGRVTQFLICAVWLQWILSAYHSVTSDLSPLGLSWNALASCVVIAAGAWVTKRRKLNDPAFIAFYVLAAAIVCSAAANHAWAGALDLAIRLAYLLVLIVATVDAISEVGTERFAKLALWPFLIPISLQALSVMLGVGKGAEADGLMTYIGGYSDEATFSLGLTGGVLLICMGQRFRPWAKVILIALCCAAFYLANYISAIFAIVPLIAVVVITAVARRIVPQQRRLAGGAMAVAIGAIVLATMAVNPGQLAGTAAASDGRIWAGAPANAATSQEVAYPTPQQAYARATPLHKVFGYGPSLSSPPTSGYAHNAISSSLYELGAVGTAAILFLWVWMIWLSLSVMGNSRWLLLGGHGTFLLLSMATMPLWNNEGVILYGLLCGFTVARHQACRRMAGWRDILDQPLVWSADAGETG